MKLLDWMPHCPILSCLWIINILVQTHLRMDKRWMPGWQPPSLPLLPPSRYSTWNVLLLWHTFSSFPTISPYNICLLFNTLPELDIIMFSQRAVFLHNTVLLCLLSSPAFTVFILLYVITFSKLQFLSHICLLDVHETSERIAWGPQNKCIC